MKHLFAFVLTVFSCTAALGYYESACDPACAPITACDPVVEGAYCAAPETVSILQAEPVIILAPAPVYAPPMRPIFRPRFPQPQYPVQVPAYRLLPQHPVGCY